MIGRKLQNILKSFNSEDEKDFLNFINSPYFNKKDDLVIFYKYLINHKNNDFDKTVLCHDIFDKPLTTKELGYLISDLMKQVELFLIYEEFKNKDALKKQYLLKQLQVRNLNKLFSQKISQYQKNPAQIKNVDYFFSKFQAYELLEHFQIANLKQRIFSPDNQPIITYFDKYFILKKLMIYCSIISRNTLTSSKLELTFYDEILNFIHLNNLREEPVIDIYYSMVEMLNQKDEQNSDAFEHLKILVNTQNHLLPKDEIYDVYLHIINYCLKKIRTGQQKFVKEALLLYKHAIESGVFIINNSLSPWKFNNVIKLAIIDNQFDWAKEFIDKNSEKLPKTFRNDAINYNLAQLLYNENKFDEALIHLHRLKHTDFSYRLGSREILAKIYYEKGEEEALLSLIASFTIFLKRNKNISSNLKVPFLNFCDLLNQILRRNPKKIQKVKEKIIKTKIVTSKSWLISTIDKELKKLNLPLE